MVVQAQEGPLRTQHTRITDSEELLVRHVSQLLVTSDSCLELTRATMVLVQESSGHRTMIYYFRAVNYCCPI
jgi:hypothetical protein